MADNQTEKQKVQELTDKLERGLTELFNSDSYKNYLSTMSKFHNYSFNNTLLIAMQKPDASLVAGFSAWKNNFERNVMKGQKGIKIIAPSPYKIKQEMQKIDPHTQKPVIGKDGKPVTEEKEITIPAYKVVSVFDVSQTVIAQAGGLIQGSTDITPDMLAELETTLEGMDLGPLLGLWLQSSLIGVTMWALGIVIFVLVYGRMLEIYLLTSLAPIPMATLAHREVGQTGQNYLRSLFAVGFQGMLILVCVAIYAVLVQGIVTSGDPIGAIWGIVGYTVLLCFMLFKTGGIAQRIFGAH